MNRDIMMNNPDGCPAQAKQAHPFVIRKSVIRNTTAEANKYGAINLGQGYSNGHPSDAMIAAAAMAILTGDRSIAEEELDRRLTQEECGKTVREVLLSIRKASSDSMNQYSMPCGTAQLRDRIAAYYNNIYNCPVDPETEITVTLGATEAVSIALRAAVKPGNAVVIIEPYHEMYINQALAFGIHPIVVTLYDDQCDQSRNLGNITHLAKPACSASEIWNLHFAEVEAAIDSSPVPVKGFILNSPHNPTGKVFNYEELYRLQEICTRRGILMITDEIYEHIIFGDRFKGQHAPYHLLFWSMSSEYRKNTLIVNSVSKTGSATGWRVGWILSPPCFTEEIRAIHDTVAMQAPTPFQYASESLLNCGLKFFFEDLPALYKHKLQLIQPALYEVGFKFASPDGSYYIFASYEHVPTLASLNATEASSYLIHRIGVAAVPGDAFFDASQRPKGQTAKYLRFAFCKQDSALIETAKRLREWMLNEFYTSVSDT